MRETLIVIRREFLERVRGKAFLISTLLMPVLLVAVWVLPVLIGSGGGAKTIAIVDEGPAGVADHIAALLSATPEGEDEIVYTIDRVDGSLESAREDLMRRVQAEELDGYIWVPPTVVAESEVAYRARNVTNLNVLEDIERAATEAVQAVRLREAGLEAADVASLVRPVNAQATRITKAGEEGGSAVSTMLLAYILPYVLFLMTIIYGVMVMNSVLEEKTSRISEVIVSSMRAGHLMAGKIVGVGLVALLQITIWAVIVLLLVTQSGYLMRTFGLPPGILDALKIDPVMGLALVSFFLLGFFLYASMFAALGAAATSTEEAQQFTLPIQMPMIVAMVSALRVTGDPLGTLATVLGLVPFTAPFTMPMRMASTAIPPLQVVGSLAILALSAVVVAWIAGKIYRVGILSTGKKPTMRELARWLRTA